MAKFFIEFPEFGICCFWENGHKSKKKTMMVFPPGLEFYEVAARKVLCCSLKSLTCILGLGANL